MGTQAAAASWPADGLKRRIRAGAALHVPYIAIDESEASLRHRYAEQRSDLAFLDLQHAPGEDRAVIACCERSRRLGVPVQVRIRHPREAYLCGRYADFGALSVVVPLVDDPAVVREAIAAFYYPPFGARSWGGGGMPYLASDLTPRGKDAVDQREYTAWWNRNAVLAIQLESSAAVRRARELALPGVDLVLFGGTDLALDLAAQSSPFASVPEAITAAAAAIAGSGVRVVPTPSPIGHLPASGALP
jgi:2-dehydro-3-deoxyglucarate aldolase/4-hydroxy-2-oxoheptanedioate aldolase